MGYLLHPSTGNENPMQAHLEFHHSWNIENLRAMLWILPQSRSQTTWGH